MHFSINDIGNTILVSAGVLFVLYRRFRRNFGRQRLRQSRMIFRMVMLGVICLILLFSPFNTTKSYMAALLGAFIGLILAVYATSHTQFEVASDGKFFIPNVYIGMIVTALFLGRLLYRFVELYPILHTAVKQAAISGSPQINSFSRFEHNPLTLGLYYLAAGYYIFYYAGILMKFRALSADTGSGDGRSKFIS